MAAALASLVAACGSSGPGQAPLPTSPTPMPTPLPRAFAYVLDPDASSLLAFAANDGTGQLRYLETEEVIQARHLAADPRGRFVYVAAGIQGGGLGRYVRSYAVDAASGHLDRRSDTAVRASCPATSLAANERQVYWSGTTCFTGYHGEWAALNLEPATGVLTQAPPTPFRYEPDLVVADPQNRFVYTAAVERDVCFYCPRVFVSALRPDGTLEDVGGMMLDRSPGPAVRASAAVFGQGMLLVADTWGRTTSFAVEEASGLLSVLRRLDATFDGGGASLALVTPSVPRLASGPSELLAVGSTTALHVYAVSASGELSLRDELILTTSAVPRSVAFHPSGRFLYASGAGEGVMVFAVGDDGRLQQIGREERGGGPIIVMAPSS